MIALALVALAGALLAGSAQAGRALARSAEAHDASIVAEGEARRSLADFVTGWSAARDSLEVGGSSETSVGPRRVGGAGLVALTRFRVLRLSSARFIVGLETSVGPPGLITARRRLSLILQRRISPDSLAGSVPTPIRQWGLADLF